MVGVRCCTPMHKIGDSRIGRRWFSSTGGYLFLLVLCVSISVTYGFVPSLCIRQKSISAQRGPFVVSMTDDDVSFTEEQEQAYIPPDFTIEGDDYDDDDYQPSNQRKEPYIPPDFTIVDDDSEDTVMENRFESKTSPSKHHREDMVSNDEPTESAPRRRRIVRRGQSVESGSSWMDRNSAFSKKAGGQYDGENEGRDSWRPNSERPARRRESRDGHQRDDRRSGDGPRTFRQDFRGTRVFVQGLPPDASWQDVKDHFRIAGDVVFASVSTDRVTGESKCCGVVQYETTEMAQTAIAIMRNHPMDDYQLFVREDVQENHGGKDLQNKMPQKKGPTPPTKWKCADEDNASFLSDEDRLSIRSLIKARDDARRRRQYDVSDNIREELKLQFGVHVDDRLKMWWASFDGGNRVPQAVQDMKGEGRWTDKLEPWRQIPTTPENDACVDPNLVNALLAQRDIARKEKDFSTADALLEEARTAPDNDLELRIHDPSRTWRIWTSEPPPRFQDAEPERSQLGPAEQCLAIVEEHAPTRIDEVKNLLEKFEGREWAILKKLKKRYLV